MTSLKTVSAQPHLPVLCQEAIGGLCVQEHGVYVDGTFGAGGYSGEILRQNDTCRVIAIDRDPDALGRAQDLRAKYPHRFSIHQLCFSQIPQALRQENLDKVDGMVFDLGVSSPQIDTPERGFSFRYDGPLDMRMGQEGESAADVVNTYGEEALADILYKYGEEHKSRKIAKTIVTARQEQPIRTTLELARLVHGALGGARGKTDPATKTFQALRIYVNRELEELESALDNSISYLKPQGRLCVVTFHSLEDRIVKEFLRGNSGWVAGTSRHAPAAAENPKKYFDIISRKAIAPDATEIARNSRARSAKLRVAMRTSQEKMS